MTQARSLQAAQLRGGVRLVRMRRQPAFPLYALENLPELRGRGNGGVATSLTQGAAGPGDVSESGVVLAALSPGRKRCPFSLRAKKPARP